MPLVTEMTADEERALRFVNRSRAAHGKRMLHRRGLLTLYAHMHSHAMARRDDLFHGHFDAFLHSRDIVHDWWGECVGVGPAGPGAVWGLHKAFMGSAPHRAIILGRFRWAGIGIVVRNGIMWETQVYVR